MLSVLKQDTIIIAESRLKEAKPHPLIPPTWSSSCHALVPSPVEYELDLPFVVKHLPVEFPVPLLGLGMRAPRHDGLVTSLMALDNHISLLESHGNS